MDIKLPDKLTFDLKEVMHLTKLDGRVLDYWEKEFGGFKAMKNASGETFYSRRDILLILKIKQWFLVDRIPKEEIKQRIEPGIEENPAPKTEPEDGKIDKKKLRILKRELQGILTLMKKNDKNRT
jgi:DNA-binding transcriptional MerR regulator